MKILSGKELAAFIKQRQYQEVSTLKSQKLQPKLLILRDNDNPVITKYVNLKIQYGKDIGIVVEDQLLPTAQLPAAIKQANQDQSVNGIIVQLPLVTPEKTTDIVRHITHSKDVDGLSGSGQFDSATATAINWLLAGHNIDLTTKKIAIVGRGRLVGAPLIKMWQNSGYHLTVFGHDADLSILNQFDLIVTATGHPRLITPAMLNTSGAIVVDAGTASEDGVLLGDLSDSARQSPHLLAVTPKIGGVGPLTVAVLFENVITSAKNSKNLSPQPSNRQNPTQKPTAKTP